MAGKLHLFQVFRGVELDFPETKKCFVEPVNNYEITMFDYENFKKLIFYIFWITLFISVPTMSSNKAKCTMFLIVPIYLDLFCPENKAQCSLFGQFVQPL